MVRYLFYTIGDLTYQSPLVYRITWRIVEDNNFGIPMKHTCLMFRYIKET